MGGAARAVCSWVLALENVPRPKLPQRQPGPKSCGHFEAERSFWKVGLFENERKLGGCCRGVVEEVLGVFLVPSPLVKVATI